MPRSLRIVNSAQPHEVMRWLQRSLDDDGPAVLPRPGAAPEIPSLSLDEDGDNLALVIETSGSTGTPKRVALSAEALRASAEASTRALGVSGQWLLALPTHYIAGASVLVRSLIAGTAPVFFVGDHFDPVRFAKCAATMTHDNRLTALVPVQLARLVSAMEAGASDVAAALRRFEAILVGGQSLPVELATRARDQGLRITTTYGSSETAGGCVYDGVPFHDVTVRSVAGQLAVSGPTLARGYLGDPARTERTFVNVDGQRWYQTGDLGTVSAGVVTVHGRIDNVIISGGEKVLLDEVERRVREQPGFTRAVVVAAPDPQWGTVPVVAVPAEDRHASWDIVALRHLIATDLGRAAAPSRIEQLSTFPVLDSGKPDRLRITAIVTSPTDEHSAP